MDALFAVSRSGGRIQHRHRSNVLATMVSNTFPTDADSHGGVMAHRAATITLSTWPAKRSLLVAVLTLAAWAVWAFVFNTGQFGDNVEQFNWAQSLEAGYHKHPPFPSWLLGGLIACFGPSIYWASMLAVACLAATATFTWLLARELLGEAPASVAVLLWGLNMSFSQRVQLYNHNTVLVAGIAGTAWFALRATRTGTRFPFGWWVATGLLAAASVLSKYQALLPLAGLLVALVASGRLRKRSSWTGALLSVAVLAALVSPHAVWVAEHGYTTLHYASEAVVESSWRERSSFLVAFVANQARVWSPALLALLLYAGWQRLRPADGVRPVGSQASRETVAWMWGLLGVGLIGLAMMAMSFGVSLRNHWGVQSMQFLGVWLAWRWQRSHPIELRRFTIAVLSVQTLMFAGYALEHLDRSAALSGRRVDTMYPARELARTALAHWTSHTDCRLEYVAGTAFDAGLVSLYAGGRLRVFDSPEATPWIQPEALRRAGALYVLEADAAIPPDVVDVVEMPLTSGAGTGHPAVVRFGILPPAAPCSG